MLTAIKTFVKSLPPDDGDSVTGTNFTYCNVQTSRLLMPKEADCFATSHTLQQGAAARLSKMHACNVLPCTSKGFLFLCWNQDWPWFHICCGQRVADGLAINIQCTSPAAGRMSRQSKGR